MGDDLLLGAERSRCLAKWNATFDVRCRSGDWRPVHMVQVAILDLRRPSHGCSRGLPKIASLEEYWHSELVDAEENRPASRATSDRRSGICWEFASGHCHYGARCYYAHTADLA